MSRISQTLMSKKLAIASATALLLCALFLGLAVLIGGDDIFHDARTFKEVRPLIDLATRKTWHWGGGDTLALDAPINIRYQPQSAHRGSPQDSSPAAPQVSLTGPADVLQHMRVSNGRIATDTSITRASGRKVEAVVSGAPIRKFVVNGGENLDLGEIDQPGLDLHINGTGTVFGRGKVARLNLVVAGPGKAELGGLSVSGDANISIFGSGDAALSPHGRVKLFIAGSGKLQLLTRPAELRQTIVGSGEVSQLAGEAAKAAIVSSGKYNYSYKYDYSYKHDAQQNPPQPPQPPMAEESARDGTVMVHGRNDTDLGHIERPQLNVTVTDSGSVTAEGKVDRLTVSIMGSGDAKLGKLAARSVSVMVMGSGSATVAPSEDLRANIMGSGNVHVLTRPAQIQRSIMGSGRIIEGR